MIITLFPAEEIFMGRLIRSLEDRHSMVTGCLIQLRFKALFKKRERLFLVFIHENSCQPKGLFWTEIKNNLIDLHSLSSSSHFLIIDLEGTLSADFTFLLIINTGVGRIPYHTEPSGLGRRCDLMLPEYRFRKGLPSHPAPIYYMNSNPAFDLPPQEFHPSLYPLFT
jgi:hypothetical protein